MRVLWSSNSGGGDRRYQQSHKALEAYQKGCCATLLRSLCVPGARRGGGVLGLRGQSAIREEPGVAHRGGDWEGQARWRRVCGACGHGATTWSVACTSHAYRRVFPRHGCDVTPHHSHPRHGQEAVQGAYRAIACEQPLCDASTGNGPSPRIRTMSRCQWQQGAAMRQWHEEVMG